MEQPMIYKHMISILKDVETIGKNKKNAQQNYQFRGIDDMYNALHDLFAKHEVFVVSEVLNEKREERPSKSGGVLLWAILDVKFTFYTVDGSCVYSVTKGEAMDSGDKASNKAMSTALKYALMQTFLIPTEERLDTEYESPEPQKKETKPEIKLINKTADEAKKFFDVVLNADNLDKSIKEYFGKLDDPARYDICRKANWEIPQIDAQVTGLLI